MERLAHVLVFEAVARGDEAGKRVQEVIQEWWAVVGAQILKGAMQ